LLRIEAEQLYGRRKRQYGIGTGHGRLLRETGTPEYREQPYSKQHIMPLCPHVSSWRDLYSGVVLICLKAFSYCTCPVVYKFPRAAAIYPATTSGVTLRLCWHSFIALVVAHVQ
jgi:hypothetical protein